MKKITKREMFEQIKTKVADNTEMVAFLDHEIELLAKKNSGEKKPTKTQEANVTIKKAILDTMEDNRLYTVTELQKSVAECKELSNQRVSALVRQLVADGMLNRTEEKRKAYFTKVLA